MLKKIGMVHKNLKYLVRNFWKLKKLYAGKKKGFTCDISQEWREGVRRSDIKVEKTRLRLSNGITGIICLYDAAEFWGRDAYGLKYDIIGYHGLKPIRECNFFEFLKIYGLTILEGIDV